MDVPPTLEIIMSGLLLLGLFFLLTGTFGLLRLKDVYSRMHATSKSSTFGVAGVLLAAVFDSRVLDLHSGLKEGLLLGFLFLTVPISAHMIARAAYRTGVSMWLGGVVDELEEWEDEQREGEGQTDAASPPTTDVP